jgi:hypothetical protein
LVVAIFGTPGYVEGADAADVPLKLRIAGANTGNLLFQHAVAGFVAGETIFVGLAKRNYDDPALRSPSTRALLFPAANMLRPGADWTGLCGFLSRVRLPLVVFGLGVQGEHGASTGELLRSLRETPSVLRLVDILRDKAAFIGVRGGLTAELGTELGLRNLHVTGCPSLMVSPDPALGRTLAGRFARLRAGDFARLRAAPARPRLVVTAASAGEINGEKLEAERKLVSLMGEGDLYVQQSGGEETAALFAGEPVAETEWAVRAGARALFAGDVPSFLGFVRRHGRIFFSAPAWMEATREAELFLGTRLHGNMLGLQQGIPAALIAHDLRTSELIRQMRMPSVPMERFLACRRLAEVLAAVEFDAEAFDAARRQAARIYVENLPGLGVPVVDRLRSLAGP